jgi:septum formation protein
MNETLAELRKNFRFVLASGSPRRRELLSALGLDFTVSIPNVPETIRNKAYKSDIVKVTLAKLNTAPERPGRIILACDTIVVCGGQVLGKPQTAEQAAQFLTLLSGKQHTVYSCLALKIITAKKIIVKHSLTATKVYFRELSEAEIAAYVKTPVPYDKAGAYGIQDTGSLFVRKLEGCYYNVVGLPVTSLIDMLKSIRIQQKEIVQK